MSSESNGEQADSIADIVVVGAGLAGLRAALEAAAGGANVRVIEKLSSPGGSTVMSSGTFAFCGTDLQRAAHIDDDTDRLRQDFLDLGHGANDPTLVERYVQDQIGEYRYLRERGISFSRVEASSGQSRPRSHCADPRAIIDRFLKDAKDQSSIRIDLGVSARGLVTDAAGRVRGVVTDSNSRQLIYGARRGVILTSGGFSRAPDLLKQFAPDVMNAVPAGGFGSQGDGLRMASDFGADLADLEFVSGTFGTPWPQRANEIPRTLLAIYRGAIAVNKRGERFTDESQSYKTLGAACLRQPDGIVFQIFDRSIFDQSTEQMPSFDFARADRENRLVKGTTLAELAQKLDVPALKFLKCVGDYNEDAGAGCVDRHFGRKSLSHTIGKIVPIAAPPFYGYACTTMISSTYAGVRVDDQARVLNRQKKPIAGLFAAGEIMGGFHGESYMTGSSLVKALVFGRIAAITALREPVS